MVTTDNTVSRLLQLAQSSLFPDCHGYHKATLFPGCHGYHIHRCFQAITVTTVITVSRLSRLPQSSARALRKLALEWKNTMLTIVWISIALERWKRIVIKFGILAYFWCRVITKRLDYGMDSPGFESRSGQEIFLFSHNARTGSGANTQIPIQWVPGLCPVVKQPRREVNH